MVLAISSVLSIAAGYLFQTEKTVDERALLKELASNAVFSEKTGAPPHYRSGENMVAFNSYDVTPHIRGYAGPIKVMLTLGSDGRIRGIKIIEHRETKNYVHYLETPQYLSRLIGKSVFDRFEVDKDIDGISRATVSVEALARTVRDSSRIVALNVYGINVMAEDSTAASEWGWVWYALLFGFAFAGYFLTRKSKRLQRLRDASLIGGVIIIGLYLSSPFSILHVFNLVLLRPSSSMLWYAIIITMILSIIIAGRFYCGWLCPFGALSEFTGRIPVKKWTIPTGKDDGWRTFKYILLGIIVVIVFTTRRVDYGNYETYVTLFSYHGNVLTWALVALSLVANLRIERFWCRYLCPVAALVGIFSRKEAGYPSRHDCPMVNKTNPEMSECIRCNKCYKPENRGV